MIEGKLENKEIKRKIKEYKYPSGFIPPENFIDSIVDAFWFHDFYNSFISDPIYLNHLLNFLNDERPEKFNRYDFYNYLFDKITGKEEKREELRKLARHFEKKQTDSVTREEYKELASSEFFQPANMEKLHLGYLGERDGKKLFIWQHHTLTEFLVAESLLSSESSVEEFVKLAVFDKDGITAFVASWSGVFLFLLQSKKGSEFLNWALDFFENNPDNIDDNISELITSVNFEVDKKERQRIFSLVYGSYFSRLTWISGWARRNIAKFVDEDSYKRLKTDIKEWQNQTETYVRRGNVVAIVGFLLRENSKLIQKDRDYWEKRLLGFANNPNDDGNGVLQRNSLSALSNFKDETLISKVADACYKNTKDTLVRDEFFQLCISTPESDEAIKYFIDGIKENSRIYPRHGLYLLKKLPAVKKFLGLTKEDKVFWEAFVEYENVFDSEDGDVQLVENIAAIANEKIISLLKKNIFTIFEAHDIYQEYRSNFIKKIIELINHHDAEFLFEILGEIEKQKGENDPLHLFFDFQEIIAMLLTGQNLEKYCEKIKGILPESLRDRYKDPIYMTYRLGDKAVYEKAVKEELIEPVRTEEVRVQEQKDFEKREKRFYEEFRSRYQESGNYRVDIFDYYKNYKKEIRRFWSKKDEEFLISIATKAIDKIDPREFKVTIPDKKTKQFTWSTVAAYYPNVISVVSDLAPEKIKEHRQEIINFIPYAFSTEMGEVLDLIPKLTDKDLEWVNSVMLDPTDDRRYLVTSSYIYLISQYAQRGSSLPTSVEVLFSFVGDSNISEYDQVAALEALKFLVKKDDKDSEAKLQEIFNGEYPDKVRAAANELLILVYQNEEAIDWRFEKIKIPLKFDRRKVEGIAHTPSDEEQELDYLGFASPLTELKEEKYLNRFFELLTYSFKFFEKQKTEQDKKEYWEYVNYLWKIVLKYVDNLKENGSLSPVIKLEKWVNEKANYENSNWLKSQISEVRQNFIRQIINFEM